MILSLPVLIGLIGIALLFDFLNGLHDAANSIATVVSTMPRLDARCPPFFDTTSVIFSLISPQSVFISL